MNTVNLLQYDGGYWGYLSDDVRYTLHEMQNSVAHFSTSFVVDPQGDVGVHQLTVLSGGLTVSSDAQIQGKLELSTGDLVLNSTLLPVYADNAAALAASAEIGRVYRTPDGTLKTVYLP